MLHLVTGGSGYLGNLIARRLHARGERVRIVDILAEPSLPSGIEFLTCDVRDRKAMARALRGVSVVHHNAAMVPLVKSTESFDAVNVLGARIVAEQSVEAGASTFVHMSSCAVFGSPVRCPVTAETPARPVESYGRSKQEGELVTRSVCQAGGLSWLAIRPRPIVGKGRLGIFQILFRWIAEGRKVYVLGSGRVPFQFIHPDDLVDAYLLILDSGKTGTFNIGTDRFGTLREGLETLIASAGTPSRVVGLPKALAVPALAALSRLRLVPLAPWHYHAYPNSFYFDVDPLTRLGWRPRYSNDELLLDAYRWYLSHRDDRHTDDSLSPHRRAVDEGLLSILRRIS